MKTNTLPPMTTRLPIQGIALDMDGLLFDTERLYWQVGDEILKRRGFRFCNELQTRMMGRVGSAAMQQMVDMHNLEDTPDALLVESEQLFVDLLAKDLQPMPGTSEWIDLLIQSKLPFGLATSSRRMFVDDILASVDWGDSLSFILTGDDVVNGKPHPEMYQLAAAKMAIDPMSMLVLEDSGNGCQAAVAAGAQTVVVPSEHTETQDFSGAILIAESLLDARLHALIG